MLISPKLDRAMSSKSRLILFALLLVLFVVGTLPGYLRGGRWAWQQPLPVPTLSELRQIRKQGITVPNYPTIEQVSRRAGDLTWSWQKVGDPQKPASILLMTQNGPKDQPQVEWSEIDGFQQWQRDSDQSLSFQVDNAVIETHFFRAWNTKRTYAVMQWYAWPQGGHPAPSRWFIADRLAQWQNRRMPWVAVCVLLPIEPLGDLAKSRDSAESLGQAIQTELNKTALR